MDFWTSKLHEQQHMHALRAKVVPVGSVMAPDGFHVNVLCDSPAAPCCRKFTVTDVDLIFQKVIVMLLPAHELQMAVKMFS